MVSWANYIHCARFVKGEFVDGYNAEPSPLNKKARLVSGFAFAALCVGHTLALCEMTAWGYWSIFSSIRCTLLLHHKLFSRFEV